MSQESTSKMLRAGAIVTASAAVIGFLGLCWYSFSAVLGRPYAIVRLIESAGLWLVTGWGRYFMSVPAGGEYEFLSIYLSSIPFGLVCAALSGAIGLLAYNKVATRHPEYLLSEAAGAFSFSSAVASHSSARSLGVGAGARRSAPRNTELPASGNTFRDVADLRDHVAVGETIGKIAAERAGVLALVLDAISPVSDTTFRPRLLRQLRANPDHTAGHANRHGNRYHDMYTLLEAAVSTTRDRDVVALDRAHELLRATPDLDKAILALFSLALASGRMRFADIAWLRTLDQPLYDRIVRLEC